LCHCIHATGQGILCQGQSIVLYLHRVHHGNVGDAGSAVVGHCWYLVVVIVMFIVIVVVIISVVAAGTLVLSIGLGDCMGLALFRVEKRYSFGQW